MAHKADIHWYMKVNTEVIALNIRHTPTETDNVQHKIKQSATEYLTRLIRKCLFHFCSY